MIDHQPAVFCFDRLCTSPDLQKVPHLTGARPHDDGVVPFGGWEFKFIHKGNPNAGLYPVVDHILASNLFREEDSILIPDILKGQSHTLPAVEFPVEKSVYMDGGGSNLGGHTIISLSLIHI